MAEIKKEELTKLQELVGSYNQHQSKLGELLQCVKCDRDEPKDKI